MPVEEDMENATSEKEAGFSGNSDGRKSSPYQRIVIACPDNHIIVVKRFTSGGEKMDLLRGNRLYDKDATLKSLLVFLTEVKVEGGRLVAVENKKGR